LSPPPLIRLAGIATGAGLGYVLVVKGALTLDVGIGRRTRPLGPIQRDIVAAPEVVFDVIASPYLGRTPRAMEAKFRVLERGADMVLAEHFTPIGSRLTATTVENVRFERPHRISFRLLRGPVPHVTESFQLDPTEDGTRFTYTGEIGADFWALGTWWADIVAERWERAVEKSLAGIIEEAERRAERQTPRPT
jgi:hypothetical protein